MIQALFVVVGMLSAVAAQAVPAFEGACARNCEARWSDGTCREYGEDYCGPYAACAAQCVARWSDGSCRDWGADYCGPHASCDSYCAEHWSDGSCRDWGADRCWSIPVDGDDVGTGAAAVAGAANSFKLGVPGSCFTARDCSGFIGTYQKTQCYSIGGLSWADASGCFNRY
jgi:hypothetical protein